MMHIEQLDALGAQRHSPALVRLLQDVVAHGASVGFLPPLSDDDANEYWHGVVSAVKAQSRVLWVAVFENEIVGSVQLDLCMRQNGLHRAEVSKLIVHSAHRRAGIGRALMQALEDYAHHIGRTTLVLDTREDDPSEMLYQHMGYVKIGAIPKYARSANGQLHTTAFYYKNL